MALVVRCIVCQCTQRKSVFIQVSRIAKQGLNEIAGPDVVDQVAEQMAAERVVAQILNHRTTVRVGMRFLQLFRRGIREPLQKERLDRDVPCRVDNGFVRQHRKTTADAGRGEKKYENETRSGQLRNKRSS